MIFDDVCKWGGIDGAHDGSPGKKCEYRKINIYLHIQQRIGFSDMTLSTSAHCP